MPNNDKSYCPFCEFGLQAKRSIGRHVSTKHRAMFKRWQRMPEERKYPTTNAQPIPAVASKRGRPSKPMDAVEKLREALEMVEKRRVSINTRISEFHALNHELAQLNRHKTILEDALRFLEQREPETVAPEMSQVASKGITQ
jgi:hypothetical protein